MTRKEKRREPHLHAGAYLPDEIAEKEAEILRANLRGDTKLADG